MFPFTKADISKLQQLGAAFVNHNAKLIRFSFRTLCLPLAQGGLSLLDPALQANALQWRWLHPLLNPTNPIDLTKPSLPYLRLTLHFFLATTAYPSYHWSILFPACRPPLPSAVLPPITILLRAADAIERKFGVCHVSMETCLRLPFSVLIEHTILPPHTLASSFRPPIVVLKHYPGVLRLTGADVFSFDVPSQSLQLRSSVTNLPHPTSSRRAIQLVRANQLLLVNFLLYNLLPSVPRPVLTDIPLLAIDSYDSNMAHLRSFLSSLLSTNFDFDSHSFILTLPTNRGYKSLPLHSIDSSSHSSSLPADIWKRFWHLQIPLNARNTWFRILHNKITPRRKLHHFLPDQFTPFCPHCHSSLTPLPPIEDAQHFLFSCPHKLFVWRQALSYYLSPRFLHFAYEEYISLLRFDLNFDRSHHSQFPDLSVFQIFACVQQGIWYAHYRQVFQHVPFNSELVLLYIHRLVSTLASQLSFDPSP